MQILLTNDDGIHASGLSALERELQSLGDVSVVAPGTEQSGVSHTITFLRPLLAQELWESGRRRWSVDGSPADCVKLAVNQLLPQRPDLIVSGVNSGLNAGINVLYSGTVAGAVEGAFFGIPSIAVSLEWGAQPYFQQASRWATELIRQLLQRPSAGHCLYNLNFPTAALNGDQETQLAVVPMGCARYAEQFVVRTDPRGRTYYWATNEPDPEDEGFETDLTALRDGKITLTPLSFDLTNHPQMENLQGEFQLSARS